MTPEGYKSYREARDFLIAAGNDILNVAETKSLEFIVALVLYQDGAKALDILPEYEAENLCDDYNNELKQEIREYYSCKQS